MSLAPSQRKALEEIHLLKCSLLPGELLEFTEQAALWNALLDAYALDPDCDCEALVAQAGAPTSDIGGTVADPPSGIGGPAHFVVKLDAADVWFEVTLPHEYGAGSSEPPQVSVKGDRLGRAEQARWQAIVAEAEALAASTDSDSEYPLYEMVSTHLLPRLHAYLEEQEQAMACATATATEAEAEAEAVGTTGPRASTRQTTSSSSSPSFRYHALFVSHHLKSPQKRRSLSQWAHELALAGFAKVGHPGVIYCEGAQADVEDFVGRVRSIMMQWLALRLRFVEPAPLPLPSLGAVAVLQSDQAGGPGQRGRSRSTWSEFEKVGEVVEEMRRLGREQFVVEMGIGSAGNPHRVAHVQ